MTSWHAPALEKRRVSDRLCLQVAKMLAESKARVERLLTEKKAQLHAVAAALVEKETLDAAQITAICEEAARTQRPTGPGAAVAAAADSPHAV
jgi:ATP-dependent Zn protease